MQETSLRLTEDSAPTLFTPASHVGSARSVRKVTSARTVLARTACSRVQALSEPQAHVDPIPTRIHACTHARARPVTGQRLVLRDPVTPVTCMIASVDQRFKAAVPVYGCGFLYDGESVQRASIERNNAQQLSQWITYNDPSSLLPYCKVPILFVNGTNDKHYPLRSYSRSYSLVPGEKAIRIEVGMQHSHQAGWKPPEIQRFIDHKLLGKPGLCEIIETAINNRIFSARLAGEVTARSATLQFTRDSGALAARLHPLGPGHQHQLEH